MPSELGKRTKIWKKKAQFDEQPHTTDMPELESEESADQKGQAIKTLTPNLMLSRLPISLAQLKAGNNSKKDKNEIRQLLYSLYRSKKKKNKKKLQITFIKVWLPLFKKWKQFLWTAKTVKQVNHTDLDWI